MKERESKVRRMQKSVREEMRETRKGQDLESESFSCIQWVEGKAARVRFLVLALRRPFIMHAPGISTELRVSVCRWSQQDRGSIICIMYGVCGVSHKSGLGECLWAAVLVAAFLLTSRLWRRGTLGPRDASELFYNRLGSSIADTVKMTRGRAGKKMYNRKRVLQRKCHISLMGR